MKDNTMAVIGIIVLAAMFFVAGIIENPADYHYGADKRQQVVRMPVPTSPPVEQPLFYGVVDGKFELYPNRWAVVEPFCKGLDEVHCRVYFVDDDRLDFDQQVVVQPVGNYNEAVLVEVIGGQRGGKNG